MTPHHPSRAVPPTRAGTARTARRVVVGAVLAALAILVLGPGAALAATTETAATAEAATWAVVWVQQPAPAPAASLDAVLTNIRNWIMGIATALATVFLSIGAVRYMAAGGDLGEVEKAKTAFRSAAFGYGIAVLAPVLVGVLQGIVGA